MNQDLSDALKPLAHVSRVRYSNLSKDVMSWNDFDAASSGKPHYHQLSKTLYSESQWLGGHPQALLTELREGCEHPQEIICASGSLTIAFSRDQTDFDVSETMEKGSSTV